LLDERTLRAGEAATLAGLVLDGGDDPLPDWQDDFDEFATALRERVASAGTCFDARRKRKGAPLLDCRSLLQVVRPGRMEALFMSISTNTWMALLAVVVVFMFGPKL